MLLPYSKSTFRASYLSLYYPGFLYAPSNALQTRAVANKQGGTGRGLMNAISRTTRSTINTALSLVGGYYTRRATAVELQRIELELVEVLRRDSEGPDEKVSRHLGRLVTKGRTLILTLTVRALRELLLLVAVQV
jgi:hypothetical protein